jgi:hypothetical protein
MHPLDALEEPFDSLQSPMRRRALAPIMMGPMDELPGAARKSKRMPASKMVALKSTYNTQWQVSEMAPVLFG